MSFSIKSKLIPLYLSTVVLLSLCSCKCFSKKSPDLLKTIDKVLLQEITNTLSKKFGTKIQIKSIVQLSEPERRNLVLRIIIQNQKDEIPTSMIFKQSLKRKSTDDDTDAFSRFARDWAGLEFLSNVETEQSLAPHFYGGNTIHRFVLFEDFGEKHVSLVDSLKGTDKIAAQGALIRFMQCLGKFHAAGYGHTSDYQTILTNINPSVESWQDTTKRILNEMHSGVKATLEALGLQSSSGIQEEMKAVIQSIYEPGDFTTYIHGDICPDNTFDYPEKNEIRLIDFECGSIGHALLDATYLRMSMPTCWCAGKIPDELIESLELEYRRELMKKVPAARNDDRYAEAYTNACAFWMLENVASGYIEGKVPREARSLSRIQAFVDFAEKYDKLPLLKNMAAQVLNELKIRWSDAKPLNFFPAFIDDNMRK